MLNEPVNAEDLLASLAPPKHFAASSFDTYRLDPEFPSQLRVLEVLRSFVAGDVSPGFFQRMFGQRIFGSVTPGRGIYLDGGFGVGKTHLLAAAFHAFEGKKAYLTFQELMFLVGLQRLDKTLESLSEYRLLALDEFELDDPANTRIASTLIGSLMNRGVDIITTSNTPPGSLGRDRFSTEDFKRELSGLAERFSDVEIDGNDYRQMVVSSTQISSWFKPDAPPTEIESHIKAHHLSLTFASLRKLLGSAHPIRIRKAIAQFESLLITDLTSFDHPHDALRFVYFIDKVYDCDIKLTTTSFLTPKEMFPESIVTGGDKKKYMRTESRLLELTNFGH